MEEARERERRARVSGKKDGKERRKWRGGGVCAQTAVDVGLHFGVHLLNVAEMRSVAAMFCSLKALPDVRFHSESIQAL